VNFTGDLGAVASSDVTAGVRHGIGSPSAVRWGAFFLLTRGADSSARGPLPVFSPRYAEPQSDVRLCRRDEGGDTG
jgi:hypothetical protein